MHCNHLVTAPFPRGVLRSCWRARKNVSVHQIFRSLPVKSSHEIHLWMYFQWERELIMFSNESFSPLKAFFLDHPSLTVGILLFGIVHFFSLPLSQKAAHILQKGAGNSVLASRALGFLTSFWKWQGSANSQGVQQRHLLHCSLKPTWERQSVCFWLVNT